MCLPTDNFALSLYTDTLESIKYIVFTDSSMDLLKANKAFNISMWPF